MIKIETIVCNPFQENCYVVSDETGEAAVIDCGVFFKDERKRITDYINSNNLKIKHLLCTHGHIDHNFGNNTIAEAFGVNPCVHTAEQGLMAKLKVQALMFCNIPLDYEMPECHYYNDGDTFCFGNHTITAIHTPGHSAGSSVLYCKEENIAFTGDTLFHMSIGRTDLEGGSYKELCESLKKLAVTLKKETVIYPGHGPESTMADELMHNPYM